MSYAGASALAGRELGAELNVVQDVPADVQAEIDVTWSRFNESFRARRACFTDVVIVLVPEVKGGDARYLDGRIEIEIPTTPGRFRESFAHELAHHVERTCPEFAELREVLHPRFGGAERAWSGGDVWEETPSELWAEAVVELVNGVRLLHEPEMPIEPSVVALVDAWGRGVNLPSPSG
jgi:hypothetical protein